MSKVGSALTTVRVWVVNLVTLGFVLYLLFLAFVVLQQRPEKVDPGGRVLILNPEGVIVDQAVYPRRLRVGALSDDVRQIQTRDLVELIEAAAADERLAGVLVDFSRASFSGVTTALTIAEALGGLKESGKPVIAYSETLSTSGYLMASQADEIYVHPAGAVNINGLGGYRNYLREMLEKLKVNIHDYSQGDYKSAAESITRNDQSEADRRQSEELLQPLWAALKSEMASARGLDTAVLQRVADEFPAVIPQAAYDNLRFAQDQGLIDGTLSYAGFRTMMIEKFGADEDSERDTYPHIVMGAYAAQMEKPEESAEASISVVYVEGTIMEGEGRPGVAGAEDIGRLMRDAYEDENTRAIVLRVNSPGGGLLASELIRDEVLAARARSIPVVASMGDLAASGGMFVSAPTDRIFAEPTTITGSVGVAIVFPTIEASLTHLGIHSDGIATSEFAGWGVNRPVDEQLDAVFERYGSSSYQRFIDVVVEGRQEDEAHIRSIAGGRVWTGARALEVGLVDELGGMDAALASAASLAEIDDYRVVHRGIEPPLSVTLARRFMADMAVEVESPFGAFGERVATMLQDFDNLSRPRVELVCKRCLVELQ